MKGRFSNTIFRRQQRMTRYRILQGVLLTLLIVRLGDDPTISADPGAINNRPVYKEVKVNFLKKGFRLMKHPAIGDDMKELGFLYIESSRSAELVNTPKALQGFVNIQTEHQAIAFCRLFTDLYEDLLLWFDPITDDESLMFVHEVTATPKPSKNVYFVIALNLYNALEMRDPIISRDSQGRFVIERNLYASNKREHTAQLYRSLETVASDGSYSHTVKKVLIPHIKETVGILEPPKSSWHWHRMNPGGTLAPP